MIFVKFFVVDQTIAKNLVLVGVKELDIFFSQGSFLDPSSIVREAIV